MSTKIIRFDCQSADANGIDANDPMGYIENKGMKVKQWKYSSFGACFFLEVENYVPDINNIYFSLDDSPENFDWQV